ncbi:MAG: UDP-N-acetylmuramate dehydrogenase [Alphaproteobacteria bacterium]|nr:UDP-N-acetylmuramate dehydrogenase [Alphaproteobacteria bacterium]
MSAAPKASRLIDRLPPVRGRLSEGYALAKVTWFQVGGVAEVMFRPEDEADLAAFLRDRPHDVPVTVLGVGSNVLVRDGGIDGVVVRLGRAFVGVTSDGVDVRAGAGALDANVAAVAARSGIAGLEFLSGVPGTIGGAVRMNAGAYGREIKDVLVSARCLNDRGQVHELDREALGLSYRQARLPRDWIVVAAHLRGEPGDAASIAARIDDVHRRREASQPVRTRTGGSTFKNPGGPDGSPKAWELIDRAGCRDLTIGGAHVSPMHCNFLENTGSASAADLEALGEEVRRRVFDSCGVMLQWEIERLGRRA